MRVKGMIDTGAILALLDRDDRWLSACKAAFAGFFLPLVTLAAVLTELFHLVGDNRYEVGVAWNDASAFVFFLLASRGSDQGTADEV